MSQAAATIQEQYGAGGNAEFSEMVETLENDPEVQQGLDGIPLPGAHAGAVITYRDPEDVRTIRVLSWGLMIALSFVLVFAGGFIYLMLQKPIMIVQDRTSGETLVIDGRQVGGRTATLEVGPEELTEQGKRSLVTHFLESLYNINPANRGAINKSIRMMDPDGALIFSRYLKENNILETQAQEEWQATWKLQDITVDERDPYILRAVGEQTIRRKVNGEFVQESRQLSVKLLLTVSTTKPKRNDNNMNTGYCVSKFKVRTLSGTEASPAALMAEPDAQQ